MRKIETLFEPTKHFIQTIESNPMALATIDKNSYPHVIAVSNVKFIEDKLVITRRYTDRTIENIDSNSSVSLVVWDEEEMGYQIEGTAEYFEDGKWIDIINSIPENNVHPMRGAIVVSIEKAKQIS